MPSHVSVLRCTSPAMRTQHMPIVHPHACSSLLSQSHLPHPPYYAPCNLSPLCPFLPPLSCMSDGWQVEAATLRLAEVQQEKASLVAGLESQLAYSQAQLKSLQQELELKSKNMQGEMAKSTEQCKQIAAKLSMAEEERVRVRVRGWDPLCYCPSHAITCRHMPSQSSAQMPCSYLRMVLQPHAITVITMELPAHGMAATCHHSHHHAATCAWHGSHHQSHWSMCMAAAPK